MDKGQEVVEELNPNGANLWELFERKDGRWYKRADKSTLNLEPWEITMGMPW